MAETTVLITGVTGRWGSRLARHLSAQQGLRVLGLDMYEPPQPVEGVTYIRADLRNPALVGLLRDEGVDVVAHLVFNSGLRSEGLRLSAEETFQINVLGTQELLGSCYAAGVRQIVLKSTTLVYGARLDNPLYLREDAPLRAHRNAQPNLRDRLEIEALVASFRKREGRPAVAMLRFPGILGPTVRSTLGHYLTQPTPPTLLGFDPLYQIIHEEDVVLALSHVIEQGGEGIYNVAADGVLALSQMIRRCGHQPLPVPHMLASGLRSLPIPGMGRALRELAPFDISYLRYQWLADTTRMRDELGFSPTHSLEETLEAFTMAMRLSPFADLLERSQDRARQAIEIIRAQRRPDDDFEPSLHAQDDEQELTTFKEEDA